MSATPYDLARALVRTGARTAMELDINPEWVPLDTARRPGGRLAAAVPGQYRPADQYLVGWTRTSSPSWPHLPGGSRPPLRSARGYGR